MLSSPGNEMAVRLIPVKVDPDTPPGWVVQRLTRAEKGGAMAASNQQAHHLAENPEKKQRSLPILPGKRQRRP